MNEYTIQPKSLGGLVRALSGLFITKENPNGLTPKECQILAALIHVMREKGTDDVTKEVKKELSSFSNHGYQIILNYCNTFKHKRVITSDNKLHPILSKQRIIIEYGTES